MIFNGLKSIEANISFFAINDYLSWRVAMASWSKWVTNMEKPWTKRAELILEELFIWYITLVLL